MTELHIPTAPAWMADAACVRHDPAWWYMDQPDRRDRAEHQMALTICRRDCRVQLTCLTYALQNETPATTHGVWGGVEEKVRKKLLRRAA